MKLFTLVALGVVLTAEAHKIALKQHLANFATDEVDDLLEKQDEKDAKEVADKEFNDANSKVNQIGLVSRQHSQAEDEDFMKSVFDQYSQAGKDKRGNPTGFDIMSKEKAFEAAQEVIMKWNDLPQPNAKKYLDDKFDKNWAKFDVNHSGFIDTTEAFQFTRQLMGTFTSLMDGVTTENLSQEDKDASDQIAASLGL